MGGGWAAAVVFSKSCSKPEGHAYAQPRPWPAQTTEGDVAGVLFGYGGGGVVATAVGSENQGLRWVAKAVGGAGSAPGGVHVVDV